jgi:AcrR family transcriptional regulator
MRAQLAAPLETVSGPKQARSEATLYRLLDAAEALLAEKGLAGLSIPEIVRRAGSSVGGFYARFRDKNELLRALEERFYRERWRDAATSRIVAAAVAELVTVTRERQSMLAAFLYRAIQDPVVRADALRFRRRASERVGALLLSRRDELSHPDPERAIDLGIQTAFALMQQHVLIGETSAGGRALSDEDLCSELTHLFSAYIGLREGKSRPSTSEATAARRMRLQRRAATTAT